MPHLSEAETLDYLRLVRRGWRAILVLTVWAMLLALAVTLATPKAYTATTQLFVSTQAGTSAQDLNQGSVFTQAQIQSFAAVVTTPAVLGPVARQIPSAGGERAIASSVNASVATGSVILSISANAASPEAAAQLANAVGTSFAKVTPTLELSPQGGQSPVKITTVAVAVPPLAPSSPKLKLNLALGLFAGLLLGIAWAIGSGRIDTRLKSPEDVADVASLPLLAVVPESRPPRGKGVKATTGSPLRHLEAYRQLRTSVRFADLGRTATVILLTSAVEGEGKTTTSVNLATAFSEAARRTLLIDADLRRPSAAQTLGVKGQVGLSNVLAGDVTLQEALAEVASERSSLWVLAPGTLPPNPSEILDSQQLDALLAATRDEFDTVIIDGPPLLPVTDGAILAAKSDATLLVLGSGRVKRGEARRALELLGTVRARCLGLVLNRVREGGMLDRGYGHYGYGGASNGQRHRQAGA